MPTYYTHDDNDCNDKSEFDNADAAIDAFVAGYGGEVAEGHPDAITICIVAENVDADDDRAEREVVVAGEPSSDLD